jgi:hypothetical protein
MKTGQKLLFAIGAIGLCAVLFSPRGKKGDDGVVYTVRTQGALGLKDNDIVQYSAEMVDEEGNNIRGGVVSWGPVNGNLPPLQELIKRVGVGGEGELLSPYEVYFPGNGESFYEKGKPVRTVARVYNVIPSDYAIDATGGQTGFFAVDWKNLGRVDTLGGVDWKKKCHRARWMDRRYSRLFSQNGREWTHWDWLGPKTGLLVRAQREGVDIFAPDIVGREMIRVGTSYQSLSRYDSNQDGEVKDDELAALDFWTDLNSNAKADPGEIRPARDILSAVSTRSTSTDPSALSHESGGATLKDGTQVGTWEWWSRWEQGEKDSGADPYALHRGQGGTSDEFLPYARLLVFNTCGDQDIPSLSFAGGGGTRPVALKDATGEGDSSGGGRWDWVGPCGGILVTSDITESREEDLSAHIYGSNTGDQPWGDSYEPLRYLDEDKNGWLEGDELSKVSVWVDRDSDGKPGAGEVSRSNETLTRVKVSPERLGVNEFGVPEGGVIFRNGKSSPSWCWKSFLRD